MRVVVSYDECSEVLALLFISGFFIIAKKKNVSDTKIATDTISSSTEDSIVGIIASILVTIACTANIPNAAETKSILFECRFLYAISDKVERIVANIPLPMSNRSARF